MYIHLTYFRHVILTRVYQPLSYTQSMPNAQCQCQPPAPSLHLTAPARAFPPSLIPPAPPTSLLSHPSNLRSAPPSLPRKGSALICSVASTAARARTCVSANVVPPCLTSRRHPTLPLRPSSPPPPPPRPSPIPTQTPCPSPPPARANAALLPCPPLRWMSRSRPSRSKPCTAPRKTPFRPRVLPWVY